MGGCVKVPFRAVATVYLVSDCEHPEDTDVLLEDIKYVLKKKYKSFKPVYKWAEPEEYISLENKHADVVVCQHENIVSVSLVPHKERPDHSSEEAFHVAWCEQVREGFKILLNKTFGGYRRKLISSNGASFYEKIGNCP